MKKKRRKKVQKAGGKARFYRVPDVNWRSTADDFELMSPTQRPAIPTDWPPYS
ncbi:uncharacterized protein FFE2_16080 [Fusarium fujikuroi]|nr:uncharacterized protein FFE2_16080 [Fusarium fujikuroi]